jgi:hypothetical protein
MTTNRFRNLLGALVLSLSGLAAVPASAGTVENGIRLNGQVLNGSALNGQVLNGTAAHGAADARFDGIILPRR